MPLSSRLIHFVLLTMALFAFWVMLSGKLEPGFLLTGLASAVVVAIVTRPLLVLPWESARRPAWHLPWLRLALYAPWLFWQLVQANLQVAWLVLHPRLPIEPQVVIFRKRLPSPIAHVTLANSITLTPGTVTIDLEGDRYVVHALSGAAARALVPGRGEGQMQRRVAAVFGVRENAGNEVG